jgi:4'-phosphopantetheinyl transferase
MAVRAVLMPIPQGSTLPPPQRLQRQRDVARRALDTCSARCGVNPPVQWPQDVNRVPQPVDGHHWSITHKPQWVAATMAQDLVGIDIEHLQPRRNTALFDRIGSPMEWDRLGGQSWNNFFRLWTAKESTVKANGRGIGAFDDCRVVHVIDDLHFEMDYAGIGWRVEHFYHDDHIVGLARQSSAWLTVKWIVEA